jgi:hypothetical protein
MGTGTGTGMGVPTLTGWALSLLLPPRPPQQPPRRALPPRPPSQKSAPLPPPSARTQLRT